MNITKENLYPYIKSWDKTINWTQKELTNLSNTLMHISSNNGGSIIYDTKLDIKIEEAYIIETIENAFQKILNYFAASIEVKENKINYYATPRRSGKPGFDFLRSSVYVPKVDLNRATIDELDKLPRLGKVTAKRIIEYRERNGGFTAIEEILNIKGITKNDFKELKYLLYVSPKTFKVAFTNPQLIEFKNDPCINTYITLIKEQGGMFQENKQIVQEGAKDIISSEIKRIAHLIEKNHFKKFHPYRKIRTSEIVRRYEQKHRVKELESFSSNDVSGATVLDDSGYYYFIQKALAKAKKRIWITMFFMAYKDEQKHPTDKLMDILVAAKNKGIDVKVILDKDQEEDPYLSRIVNKDAYEKFKEAGIDVIFDEEERLTHSKVIIIDDKHLVIGSHNWTAGSYFIYDDKSIYVESPDMVKNASDKFKKLWNTYSKNAVPY